MQTRWPLIIAGSLLMAGCGAKPLPVAPVPSAAPPVSSAPAWMYPAQAAPIAQAPQGQMQAQALLAGMGQAVSSMRSLTYQAQLYCRGSWGTKPKPLSYVDGNQWEANTTYQTAYQAPSTYNIDVTSCTNPNSNGMRMLVQGTSASVKMSGLLGLVTLHFDLSDSQMRDFRGNRLDDNAFAAEARRFAAPPPADAQYLGPSALDGRPIDLVLIPHGPSFDPTIVREVLGIDRQNHLPVIHAMYTGSTAQSKVYEMDLHQVVLNPSLSSDQLSL